MSNNCRLGFATLSVAEVKEIINKVPSFNERRKAIDKEEKEDHDKQDREYEQKIERLKNKLSKYFWYFGLGVIIYFFSFPAEPEYRSRWSFSLYNYRRARLDDLESDYNALIISTCNLPGDHIVNVNLNLLSRLNCM